MLRICGRILVGTDYYSWTFVMTQISTSTVNAHKLSQISAFSFSKLFSWMLIKTFVIELNTPKWGTFPQDSTFHCTRRQHVTFLPTTSVGVTITTIMQSISLDQTLPLLILNS
jgi:hypothetical protein